MSPDRFWMDRRSHPVLPILISMSLRDHEAWSAWESYPLTVRRNGASKRHHSGRLSILRSSNLINAISESLRMKMESPLISIRTAMPITAQRPEDGVARLEEDQQEVQISRFPDVSSSFIVDVAY
jgi:hypothetical protein